jgi:predicted acylesterase/phospholipase RssA
MPDRSGRTLRVAIACAGGVSIGTFIAGALPETLKKLVAFGGYSHVEVDVLSGASAGSATLCLLLRSLAAPNLELDVEAGANLLQSPFADAYRNPRSVEVTKSLVALERASITLKDIWCRQLNLDKLLEHRKGQTSLFNREVLDRAAARVLSEGKFSEEPSLLAKRVLFACSLFLVDGKVQDGRAHAGLLDNPGVLDALASKSHKDCRVFDLNWKDISKIKSEYENGAFDERVSCWYRAHLADRLQRVTGDLRDISTWEEIAATSLASSSFPMAFEPVSLNRYQWEMPHSWPPELRNRAKQAFLHWDGGVLNNEPLREAYHLASYLDTLNESDTFDRIILFIDPNVSSQVSWAPTWIPRYADGKPVPVFRSLLDNIGQFATTVSEQASLATADEIGARSDVADRQRELQEALVDLASSPDSNLRTLQSLRWLLDRALGFTTHGQPVPTTRLTLTSELTRALILDSQRKHPRFGRIHGPAGAQRKHVVDFLKSLDAGTVPPEPLADWQHLLSCVAFDLASGLRLKWEEKATVVTLTPQEHLPGKEFFSFAGFGLPADFREAEFGHGRFCSWSNHTLHQFLGTNENPLPISDTLPLPAADQGRLKRRLDDIKRKLLEGLVDRLRLEPKLGYVHKSIWLLGIQQLIKWITSESDDRPIVKSGLFRHQPSLNSDWVQDEKATRVTSEKPPTHLGNGGVLNAPGVSLEHIRGVEARLLNPPTILMHLDGSPTQLPASVVFVARGGTEENPIWHGDFIHNGSQVRLQDGRYVNIHELARTDNYLLIQIASPVPLSEWLSSENPLSWESRRDVQSLRHYTAVQLPNPGQSLPLGINYHGVPLILSSAALNRLAEEQIRGIKLRLQPLLPSHWVPASYTEIVLEVESQKGQDIRLGAEDGWEASLHEHLWDDEYTEHDTFDTYQFSLQWANFDRSWYWLRKKQWIKVVGVIRGGKHFPLPDYQKLLDCPENTLRLALGDTEVWRPRRIFQSFNS